MGAHDSDLPAALPTKEQLRWQCRRGMLELDFVLARYLDERFDNADSHEQARFAALLTAQDPELQLWLLSGEQHPDRDYHSLIERIRRI